jgi:hypothetical protein
MRLSTAIALLTETQQLDDRIRFVIKQLKLPIKDTSAPAPGPEDAVGDIAGGRDFPPDLAQRMAARRGKTKDEWMHLLASFAVADPTGDKGSYLQWITKQVLEGGLVFPEDVEKTREELAKFKQLTQSPKFIGDKNLMSYASFADLHDAVVKNAKSDSSKISSGDHLFGMKGVDIIAGPMPVRDVIYDKTLKKRVDRGPLGIARMVKVDEAEAGNKLFRLGGATWCVKDPKYFQCSSYSPPYYMIELKKAPDGTDFLPVYLHDRKSFSLKRANDSDANIDDMRPYGQLLKEAGILDDKRGLQYVLTNGAGVKESQPLAYLAVMTSDDQDLKMQAVKYIEDQVTRLRARK